MEVVPEDDGLVEGPESFNVTLTLLGDNLVELVSSMAIVVIEEGEWTLVVIRVVI